MDNVFMISSDFIGGTENWAAAAQDQDHPHSGRELVNSEETCHKFSYHLNVACTPPDICFFFFFL